MTDKPKKYEAPEALKERVRELVKGFMAEEKISVQDLALKLNEKYNRSASRTNILNKLNRASFSLAEFIQILEAYDYEISLKKTDRTPSDDVSS